MTENLQVLLPGIMQPWFAQVPVLPPISPPETTAVFFSGPRFFVALIAGVALAFAFQLLLTNLSVAIGISYLSHQDDDHDDHPNGYQRKSDGIGRTIYKISFAVGFWTLLTVSIALFVACYLAIKLSLLLNPFLGAIVGLVIWATYFSALAWLSSTTVGSLLGSMMNTVTSGFQAMLSTATAMLGGKMAGDRMAASAGAAAAAVRRELTAGMDPTSLRHSLEDYLDALRPPDFDFRQIRKEFEELLHDPDLQSIAEDDRLNMINRQTFVDLISRRTDLSKRDVERLADQLEAAWRKVLRSSKSSGNPLTDLQNYVKSALPDQLTSGDFGKKLDQLVNSLSSNVSSSGQQQPSLTSQAGQLGLTALMGTIMGRKDLSDIDVEKILNQLKSTRDRLSGQGQKLAQVVDPSKQVSGPIRSDVEYYLYHAHSWEMTPANLNREFSEVLYDPDADPIAIQQQIEAINRDDFVSILTQRGVFTQEEIAEIADRLEAIRLETLSKAKATAIREQMDELRAQTRRYLMNASREELLSDNMAPAFAGTLTKMDVEPEAIRNYLNQLEPGEVRQILEQRQVGSLQPGEIDQILNQIRVGRERALSDVNAGLVGPGPHLSVQAVESQAQDQYDQLTHRLSDYLRRTRLEELNPEGIQRDLALLADDPQAGMWALRRRLSQMDRDTLVKLLSQRQDLSEEQVNRTIDQLQTGIRQFVRAPRRLANRTQQQVFDVETSLENYLRNTNRAELNPEGIKRDLNLLWHDPRAGMSHLGQRLSRLDRHSMVALLSQRGDISEEEANRIVDQIESVQHQIIAQVQSVQDRFQSLIDSLFDRIRDYLNSLERPELNYDGIQQDVRQLFNDPQAGFESLRDRLGHVNRDTLIAILSSRDDISEADANRILNQVESARTSVLRRAERIHHSAQLQLEELRHQAKKQAAETRRAAEVASWWLFGTALVSALASAGAGAIAVLR